MKRGGHLETNVGVRKMYDFMEFSAAFHEMILKIMVCLIVSIPLYSGVMDMIME